MFNVNNTDFCKCKYVNNINVNINVNKYYVRVCFSMYFIVEYLYNQFVLF